MRARLSSEFAAGGSCLVAIACFLLGAPSAAWCLPGAVPDSAAVSANVPPSDPPTLRIEAGGGLHSTFDADHRERFGSENLFSLALSAPLGDTSNRAFLEVGYSSGKGNAFGNFDPTFEEEESSYSAIPILLGLRLDTTSGRGRSPVGATIGLAFGLEIVSVDSPLGPTEGQTSQGFVLDLRPEAALGGPWRVWARGRLALMTAVGGDGSRFPEVDRTGSGLQLGIARDLLVLGR